MKASYNWLQDNFEHKLPDPEEVKERVVMHAFEVESVDEVDALGAKDYLFDIKILPNRAHDCNSHLGLARELAVLFDLPLKEGAREEYPISHDLPRLSVNIADGVLCPRYMGRLVKNIKVAESPLWLKQRLVAIDQRSINNIVDLANYVMFQTGQPLHVFDADKVIGGINVRAAKAGEKMTTLDGKVLELDPSMLVIADDHDALALAGIKGGTKAATTAETKNIIIEAANFQAAPIRRTSQKTGIRTDASFRFEHEIAPEVAELGMEELTRFIIELAGSDLTEVGALTDIFPNPRGIEQISFDLSDIEKVLGIRMNKEVVEELLGRFKRYAGFDWEKNGEHYNVLVPNIRLDLINLHGPYSGGVKEDMIEELGRVYGYEKIPSKPLEVIPPGPVDKMLYYTEAIRDILVAEGFSEVYNYSLVAENAPEAIELRNPLSEDKKYIRTELAEDMRRRLTLNIHNKDLLGVDQVRMFEIGRVFQNINGESTHCVIALEPLGKKYDTSGELQKFVDLIKIKTGLGDMAEELAGEVIEFDLSAAIEGAKIPDKYQDKLYTPPEAVYHSISPFPFITRDIAVFVPSDLPSHELLSIIQDNAGSLLVRHKLFDTFTKKFPDGSSKTSYAFRLVFQAAGRTLTNEEVNAIMDKITNILNAKEGWQVR